jgi:carboxymethylenebutenolidase
VQFAQEDEAMADDTFTSAGISYKISVYPGSSGAKKLPIILLMHGNFGLAQPYGDQLRTFAKELADLGYVTAVPQYYQDNGSHPTDTIPHDRTLADAIASLAKRPDADGDRLGLVGFSLGATTSMTFVATNPPGAVKALADFFGFLTPTIRGGVGRFPPTIIFHNKNDRIVPVQNSEDLDRLLQSTVDHELVPPYDEHWQEMNHAFKPGGAADVDSRKKTADWFVKHLPPTGR